MPAVLDLNFTLNDLHGNEWNLTMDFSLNREIINGGFVCPGFKMVTHDLQRERTPQPRPQGWELHGNGIPNGVFE